MENPETTGWAKKAYLGNKQWDVCPYCRTTRSHSIPKDGGAPNTIYVMCQQCGRQWRLVLEVTDIIGDEPMCYIHDNKTIEAIEGIVKKFRCEGLPFTGYDVWCDLRVQPGLEDTYHRLKRDVSSYVRELFNTGSPLFAGWGCKKVDGYDPSSPVLYFKITRNTLAAQKSREIKEAMSNAKLLAST